MALTFGSCQARLPRRSFHKAPLGFLVEAVVQVGSRVTKGATDHWGSLSRAVSSAHE